MQVFNKKIGPYGPISDIKSYYFLDSANAFNS